ncbi:MAG: glycosyltransferase [Polyangiaceae bacterium]|nr:glycosyltransferase [Polyangiaceae bacterium]
MRTLNSVDEFVTKLHDDVVLRQGRYIFFLGAGCSISSGIPSAAALTRRWMDSLVRQKRCPADVCIPGYDENNAARFYGHVFEQLCGSASERQEEIESICKGAKPGFGYAILASLMTHKREFGAVLTTNFDDLIAHSFYLYTDRKPLVIPHESLARFVRLYRDIPTIVKIHGDQHLDPRNTESELDELAQETREAMRKLLEQRGLIFVGYAGNDRGVARALGGLASGHLRNVYWVNTVEPGDALRASLEQHKFTWVTHLDFDELMLRIQNEFEITHPERSRLSSVFDAYDDSLVEKMIKLAVPPTAEIYHKSIKLAGDARFSKEQRERLVKASRHLKSTELKERYLETRDWRLLAERIQHDLANQLDDGDEAAIAERSDNINEAKKLFESHIAEHSGETEFLIAHGDFLKDHGGDNDAAIDQYWAAFRANPDAEEPRIRLSASVNEWGALGQRLQQALDAPDVDFAKARALFEHLEENWGRNDDFCVAFGDLLRNGSEDGEHLSNLKYWAGLRSNSKSEPARARLFGGIQAWEPLFNNIQQALSENLISTEDATAYIESYLLREYDFRKQLMYAEFLRSAGRQDGAVAQFTNVLKRDLEAGCLHLFDNATDPGLIPEIIEHAAFKAKSLDAQRAQRCFESIARKFHNNVELQKKYQSFLEKQSAAPSVDPQSDVVLLIPPMAHDVWAKALPGVGESPPIELHVETPPQEWHQTEPSTSHHWNLVQQRLYAKLDELQNINCNRIYIFASLPYSLGGFLGNQLAQRFRGGRKLVFYQFNENSEEWEDWGPNRRQPVSPLVEPFLKMSRVDGAPEGSERGEARHIVVAIHISQRLSKAELGTVLALADARRIDVAPVNGVNQSALQDAGSVDRCVRDLREILFQIATENPRAKLHVFYVGPLVVWMRASAKLHLLPVPAVLYERVFEEGRFRFVPGLELQQQKLLMGAPVAGQQGDASGAAPAALPPRLRVLAVADEWESKKGGLSTFNRLLCKALAQAGHEVLCLVPGASEEEHRKASDAGVRLVEADALKLPDIARICLKPLNVTLAPHVIIGHGRVTGEAARIQARTHFPGSLLVHFIHTASGHIEWFKGDLLAEDASRKVDERTADEVRLASMADLVVGVGPVLTNAVQDEIHTGAQKTVPIHRFDPGLIDISPVKTHPQKIRCLLLGRAEDRRLKGIDIAVRALGALRDPPELVIRGVPPGEAVEFTQWVNSQAKTVEVRPFEYSAQEETIAADIRKASLVLMPSRAEGFGLVGLEAISAAVPVLVSNQSGLGEILQNDVRTDAAKCAVVLTSGVDDETNIAAWSQAIKNVLFDRNAAYERAAQLRGDVAKVLDWASSVKKLVAELQKIVDTRASAGTPST